MPLTFSTHDFQGHWAWTAAPSWKEQESEGGMGGDFRPDLEGVLILLLRFCELVFSYLAALTDKEAGKCSLAACPFLP